MILSAFKSLFFKANTFFWTFLAKRKVSVYGEGLKVNYRCQFTRKSFIGKDCHFNGISVVGSGNLIIGDHFHSGSEILVITQNHNYEDPELLPYDENDIVRDVTIGQACWIGSRVIILPGTVISDGVVAQAGAVLFGKIPRCAVVGGNPWRVLKYRNVEKFDQLILENKFV
jgi:acetyltransferase-like isoleucine patch superfamily enzyme